MRNLLDWNWTLVVVLVLCVAFWYFAIVGIVHTFW
jgi:hypothetical protein